MCELQKDIGICSHASLAQSAERVTFNHVVASSSLARGDFIFQVDPRVPKDLDADTVLAQQLRSSICSAVAHVARMYDSKACRV